MPKRHQIIIINEIQKLFLLLPHNPFIFSLSSTDTISNNTLPPLNKRTTIIVKYFSHHYPLWFFSMSVPMESYVSPTKPLILQPNKKQMWTVGTTQRIVIESVGTRGRYQLFNIEPMMIGSLEVSWYKADNNKDFPNSQIPTCQGNHYVTLKIPGFILSIMLTLKLHKGQLDSHCMYVGANFRKVQGIPAGLS